MAFPRVRWAFSGSEQCVIPPQQKVTSRSRTPKIFRQVKGTKLAWLCSLLRRSTKLPSCVAQKFSGGMFAGPKHCRAARGVLAAETSHTRPGVRRSILRFTTRSVVQSPEFCYVWGVRGLSRRAIANAAVVALLLCGAAAPPPAKRPPSSQPPAAHDHAAPLGQPNGPILQPPQNVDPGMVLPAPHQPGDSMSVVPPGQVNPRGQNRVFQ